jgi:hypothetical protein
LVLAGLWLGWGWAAEAQHLYDVGQKNVTSEQVTALQARQSRLQTLDVPTFNRLTVGLTAVDSVDRADASIILRNEESGQSVVLSGFASGSREIELPPLLLAELKAGALGEAARYSYTVVETGSNGTTTVKSQAVFAMARQELKLPVFNYGPADAVKSTAVGERKVVGVAKAKPHVLIADHSDPALVEKAARMEEGAAYYVYTYQLPDGSLSTYDEQLQVVNLQGTVTGSLTFQISATGSTAAQDAADAYVAGLWGAQLSGPVPVTVTITFSDFGVGNEKVIGQSLEPAVYKNGGIYYPSALRNQKVGYDVNKQMADIRLEFNTHYSFYYGTDGNCPSGQIDYPSVLLHEMCHGLGFYSSIDPTTGHYGSSLSTPLIFDSFLYYNGARLTASSATTRAAAMTSNALYYDGPNAVAANGGSRIQIYAPTTYASGSSGSHWDESIPFPTFMKYAYHQVVHTFNTRKLGVMKDLGWTLASEAVAPTAPGNVAASDDLADRVHVTWNVSTNATSYKIFRYTTNTSASASQVGTASTTSFDDTNAVAGVTYYYWVKAANATGTSGFSSSETGIRISPAPTLAAALDATELTWTNGGNADWFSQSAITHDGVAAAQSGAITNNQESSLETTVNGPGTVDFWWKLSCENGTTNALDWLQFSVDGVEQGRISGEVDWQEAGFSVGTGTHQLSWIYHKDPSASAGADAGWLDEVRYAPLEVFGFEVQSGLLTATNGLLRMTVVGTADATLVWESSSNLLQWAPWGTNTLTNGVLDMQIPIGTNDQQFFRLRMP